jgi:regulator of protease activity HflC (stomatin/prohibitin superfamily)
MNIEILIAIAIISIVLIFSVSGFQKIRRAFIVPEGYAGVLYRKGKFVELLGPGRHIRWGRFFTIEAADIRKAFVTVSGQEVLTADNVNLKISVLLHYQVTDPIKATHETQHWHTDLYNIAQLALRAAIAVVPAEALLAQRLEIGAQLLARMQPEAAKIGVLVHAIDIKDVMFPAELKRAFSEALKAKQEGQAALERARAESAALRNLANAARLLDENPALMNLRVLQSLAAAQNAGNTLVLGLPGGFVPLKNGKPHAAPSEKQD